MGDDSGDGFDGSFDTGGDAASQFSDGSLDGSTGADGDAGDGGVVGAAPGEYPGPTVDAGVFLGKNADGTTMTVPTWGGEQPHIWREGHNPDNPIRTVVDQQGNAVAWDARTGQVTTAIHEQPGIYSVSTDLPSFDD